MTNNNIIDGGEIETEIPVTLGELVMLLLESHEDKVLQVDSDTGEEYRADYILKQSIRLARWLQSRGLRPGDTISIMSENRLEFGLIPCAAYLSAITLAPLNPEYTPDELKHTLSLSKPKVVFCSPNCLNRIVCLTGTNPFIKHVVVFGRNPHLQHSMVISFENALEERFLDSLENEQFVPPEVDTDNTVATIMCSSGTTGLPKGVMTTQKNILTFFSILKQIANQELQEVSSDTTVGLTPFFHSMGFMVMTLALLGGRKLIIIKKFSLRHFLKTLQDFKITVMGVPPPIIVLLCQSPLTDQYDLSSIREIRCGAAPLAKDFERRIKQKLKITAVQQAYGMTETTLGVVFMPPEVYKVGSIGKVVPGMLGKVISEDGVALGPNREGELCFKGPLIMKGYVNDVVATENTVDKDGWLHSGDIGYYDENGFFYIVDRIKELIKYKAYQVAPAELEAILLNHPAVLDAAVIGLPDDQAGELPLGYVVLKPGVTINTNEIKDFVKGKVSSQKQLRGGVRIIESIPRNPSGKILRRVLKKMAVETKSKL